MKQMKTEKKRQFKWFTNKLFKNEEISLEWRTKPYMMDDSPGYSKSGLLKSRNIAYTNAIHISPYEN